MARRYSKEGCTWCHQVLPAEIEFPDFLFIQVTVPTSNLAFSRYTSTGTLRCLHATLRAKTVLLTCFVDQSYLYQGFKLTDIAVSCDRRNDSNRLNTINGLFEDLASNFGYRAVVVVLSGHGNDGQRGVQAVVDEGTSESSLRLVMSILIPSHSTITLNPGQVGSLPPNKVSLTFKATSHLSFEPVAVDDPKANSMPMHAISTGVVDFVGSPREIAGAILHPQDFHSLTSGLLSEWVYELCGKPLGSVSGIHSVWANELTSAEEMSIQQLFGFLEARKGIRFQQCEDICAHVLVCTNRGSFR